MVNSELYCQEVWRDFSRCRQALALGQKVFTQEPVSIECTKNALGHSLQHEKRLITLLTGDPLGTSHLLLEILRLSRFEPTDPKIPNGYDFSTLFQHHKTAFKCIHEGIWPPDYDLYATKINEWLPDPPIALIGVH